MKVEAEQRKRPRKKWKRMKMKEKLWNWMRKQQELKQKRRRREEKLCRFLLSILHLLAQKKPSGRNPRDWQVQKEKDDVKQRYY